jgi:hypothetical protein
MASLLEKLGSSLYNTTRGIGSNPEADQKTAQIVTNLGKVTNSLKNAAEKE